MALYTENSMMSDQKLAGQLLFWEVRDFITQRSCRPIQHISALKSGGGATNIMPPLPWGWGACPLSPRSDIIATQYSGCYLTFTQYIQLSIVGVT